MKSLEKRVADLEQAIRVLKAAAEKPSAEVRARRITIVGANGKPALELVAEKNGCGRIAVLDGKGSELVSFAIDKRGDGIVTVSNRKGCVVAELGADEAGAGEVTVYNAKEKPVAIVGVFDDGTGYAATYDDEGNDLVRLGSVDGEQGGCVTVGDGRGHDVAVLGADSNTGEGWLSIRNRKGSELVGLASTDTGGGRVDVSDPKGTTVAYLGGDKDGGFLGVDGAKESASVFLNDGEVCVSRNTKAGESLASIRAGESGGQILVWGSAGDHVVTFLGVDEAGNGHVELSDPDGNVLAGMGVDHGGGVIGTHDCDGNSLVQVGFEISTWESEDGQDRRDERTGRISTYGRDETVRVTISATQDESGLVETYTADGERAVALQTRRQNEGVVVAYSGSEQITAIWPSGELPAQAEGARLIASTPAGGAARLSTQKQRNPVAATTRAGSATRVDAKKQPPPTSGDVSDATKKYQLYKNSGALDRVRDAVDALLADQSDLVVEEEWWRHYRGFRPKDWITPGGDFWDSTSETLDLLGFTINSVPGSLRIQLIMYGPGAGASVPDDRLREKWLVYAWNHRPPFSPSRKELGDWNNTMYSTGLLSGYAPDLSKQDIESALRRQWQVFRHGDYQALLRAVDEFTRAASGQRRRRAGPSG